jgi:hypothetical protein
MKFLAALVLLGSFAHADSLGGASETATPLKTSPVNKIRTADIGFPGSDLHIGYDLDFKGDDTIYTFRLCSNKVEKCKPISSCKYSEQALRAHMKEIANPKVRADFDWIFNRSDKSSVDIKTFYEEFGPLLKKANSKCGIPSFDQLEGELRSKLG